MNFDSSTESTGYVLYGDVFRKYILTRARFYNNPSKVEGISRAVVVGDLSRVKRLVETGANINVFDAFGNGPIYIAVVKNNFPILCYLLSLDDISINHQNFLGETPLFKALMDEKFEIAKQLILAGADVNIADNSHLTPLHLAISNPETAQMLIQRGADVDAVDTFGQTPLFCAVQYDYLETVHMLLYYNADVSIPNQHNYTPFILAMEKRNVAIQEALFEYIADYEDVPVNSDFSTLGLAMIYNSPFTEEMILRGADVNNVNSYSNGAYSLILHNAGLRSNMNLNMFKLIWERIDYEPAENISVLGQLLLLQAEVFQSVLDIFINNEKSSDKFPVIAESVRLADDLCDFITKCIECNLPFEKFTEFFCLLLCYGYTPKENDLIIVFNYWGYCEMFRILLYMDIRSSTCFTSVEKIPATLIHEVSVDVNELFSKLVDVIGAERYSLDGLLSVIILRVLDYYAYPPLFDAYLKLNKTDCVSLKMRALSKVPSLLELARDQTREHIKKSYQVKTSCELYTLINDLCIADYYKKILSFETVTYRPTFTAKDFKEYISVLERIHTRKLREPLIRAAVKNSVVKY